MSALLSLAEFSSTLEKRYGGIRTFEEKDPLDQLILIHLADGSTSRKAAQALGALRERFVDWNEVRVSTNHEVADAISPVGPRNLLAKAARLRDLLSTVYARFNKMSLVCLRDPEDKAAPRKLERLMIYLNGLSSAFGVLLEAFLGTKNLEIDAGGGIPRVLSRYGIVKKGTSPAQIRKKIESELPEDDRLVFLWGIHQLAESTCDRSAPLCESCCFRDSCETAPEEIAKAEDQRRKESDRLAKEAARDAARRDKDEREKKRLEDAAKRDIEAQKKKAEREAKEAREREAKEKKRLEIAAKKEAAAAAKAAALAQAKAKAAKVAPKGKKGESPKAPEKSKSVERAKPTEKSRGAEKSKSKDGVKAAKSAAKPAVAKSTASRAKPAAKKPAPPTKKAAKRSKA